MSWKTFSYGQFHGQNFGAKITFFLQNIGKEKSKLVSSAFFPSRFVLRPSDKEGDWLTDREAAKRPFGTKIFFSKICMQIPKTFLFSFFLFAAPDLAYMPVQVASLSFLRNIWGYFFPNFKWVPKNRVFSTHLRDPAERPGNAFRTLQLEHTVMPSPDFRTL